jgi:DNA anti-recombination protein RmuC
MNPSSDGKKPADKVKGVPTSPAKATETGKVAETLESLEPPSHNNIEKIRTILFGNQVREIEARFARIEEQLSKDLAELRSDFRRRSDALEAYVRQELDAVSERMSGEYGERSTQLSELQSSLEDLGKGLDKRAHQLDEQMTKANRELRQQVLTQSKQLRDELEASVAEISALVERELKQIRTDKTDRSALASMLTDLAARLSADG